jgi:hypothetical protein
MNYLIILLLFAFGCSNSNELPKGWEPISQEDARQIRTLIRAEIERTGLFPEEGENLFYRWGYYIYGLTRHNLLETEDIETLCEAVKQSKGNYGIYRRPEIKRYCSKDDYTLLLLALYYGNPYHPCASELFNWTLEHRRLDQNAVWLPHYTFFFARLAKTYKPGMFSDWDLYLASKLACDKPETETSDKLLLFPLQRIALDIFPTNMASLAWKYCHNRVDYNYTIDYYYCRGNHGCNHYMVKLLWGLMH